MMSMWIDVPPGVRLRVRHEAAADSVSPARAGPDAVPFVLVHGLASNARLWDGVATILAAAGHPTYAVDLRSHGESDAPDDGYDTATAADDLAAVHARLGLPPAILVGQSWGGNVVARLAAEHPTTAAAIALVDGGWIDLASRFTSWDECADALRPPDIDGQPVEQVRTWLTTAHPHWSTDAINATLASLRVAADGTTSRRLAVDRHMRIVRSMWDGPPWADLARIPVPALLLPAVPLDDPTVPEAVLTAAATLAQARIKPYVGGDHDLHAQQPEAVAADLLSMEVT